MDPNLFHVDWEQLTEVLVLIIVLSFFVERALSLLFEHRWFIRRCDQRGFKEPIALALAFVVCLYADFDAVAIATRGESTGPIGMLITAAIIAGGSKASIRLFHDILDVRSRAEKERTGRTGNSDAAQPPQP